MMRCWRPVDPPRLSKRERELRRRIFTAGLKHSLDDHERRRCAARKGWRTRKAKERS